MRILTAVLAILIAVTFVGSAMASAPGKSVEYEGGGAGKVVFDGKSHADKGGKCNDCHTSPWPMKKGTKITMADHVPGKLCGKCHDGTKAFGQDAANCAKCHKK